MGELISAADQNIQKSVDQPSHTETDEEKRKRLEALQQRRALDIVDVEIFQKSSDSELKAEAFGRIYDRYYPLISRYIYLKIGDIAETEEQVAIFFFKVLDKLHTFKDQGWGLNPWMFRVAHNLIANYYRAKERRGETSLDTMYDEPSREKSIESLVMGMLDNEFLYRAIARLSVRHQRVVKLKLEGLENEKIAVIMKLTEGAVKSLYHRALERLKKIMEEMGYETAKKSKKTD